MNNHILAVDQGTTNSRALLFNDTGEEVSVGQQRFIQHFAATGSAAEHPNNSMTEIFYL